MVSFSRWSRGSSRAGSIYLTRTVYWTCSVRRVVSQLTKDSPALETEATSADGTRVPLSIVYRRDIQLDGRSRAIITAYGGYGFMSAPSFQPGMLQWVRAGGVWAVAHVRGGGELGEDWHQAGQGMRKVRGVEDLVACARELAKRGYTAPPRTALMGSSMGALLIGGAIARFPRTSQPR